VWCCRKKAPHACGQDEHATLTPAKQIPGLPSCWREPLHTRPGPCARRAGGNTHTGRKNAPLSGRHHFRFTSRRDGLKRRLTTGQQEGGRSPAAECRSLPNCAGHARQPRSVLAYWKPAPSAFKNNEVIFPISGGGNSVRRPPNGTKEGWRRFAFCHKRKRSAPRADAALFGHAIEDSEARRRSTYVITESDASH